jgi:hypothetical protein
VNIGLKRRTVISVAHISAVGEPVPSFQIWDCEIYQGGLMRCCEQSLEERGDEVVEQHQILACRYCRGKMLVGDKKISWLPKEA